MGFDYFYGFVGGDANQWQPNLFRNTTAIYPYIGNPGWNLITAMADDAIEYMKRITAIDPDQPFFVYYVPGAVHAPHHPTPEWIKKVSDMHLFDKGWNQLRETDLREPEEARRHPEGRQADALAGRPAQALGSTRRPRRRSCSSARPTCSPPTSPTPTTRSAASSKQVEDMGKLDNTLIIYIAGDNGNSAEGHADRHAERDRFAPGHRDPGRGSDEVLRRLGDATRPTRTWRCPGPGRSTRRSPGPSRSRRTSAARGRGWPISWPKVIKDKGGIRNQFHHVIDIVPTILEATGITPPDVVDGIKQKPIEGVSLAYTFDAKNANVASRAPHPVLRDDGRPRHLPRRLDRQHQGACAPRGLRSAPVSAGSGGLSRTSSTI